MTEQEQGIMSLFEAEAHSFVLRIWRESRDDPDVPAEWRGWIDHVQSGERYYFRDPQDIGQIIIRHINGIPSELTDQVFMPIEAKDEQG